MWTSLEKREKQALRATKEFNTRLFDRVKFKKGVNTFVLQFKLNMNFNVFGKFLMVRYSKVQMGITQADLKQFQTQ